MKRVKRIQQYSPIINIPVVLDHVPGSVVLVVLKAPLSLPHVGHLSDVTPGEVDAGAAEVEFAPVSSLKRMKRMKE